MKFGIRVLCSRDELELVRFDDDKTPLHVALELLGGTSVHAATDIKGIVNVLLQHGADANAQSPPLD